MEIFEIILLIKFHAIKNKDYRKYFILPYKMELLKLPTYLERATYIVNYCGEISMDKKLMVYVSQLLE
ncbi:hypothetical protein [Staphylococcus epidermidis]|uniref:hypothetical protein n=1 Tax=Staphylococcus epidermidis TaxID=1282 RepID=UPI001EEE3377|nr:hypothetical protein [Staphylococcus epidermidis]